VGGRAGEELWVQGGEQWELVVVQVVEVSGMVMREGED